MPERNPAHSCPQSTENILKSLSDVYNLDARASFRLIGEQIDGSFQMGGDTYLVEAKWENRPTRADELRIFNDKVERKTSWSRGLFISYTGFTDDGLHAFGSDRSIFCMNGLDLHETLRRELPLQDVLTMKARRAAETGQLLITVRDLLP